MQRLMTKEEYEEKGILLGMRYNEVTNTYTAETRDWNVIAIAYDADTLEEVSDEEFQRRGDWYIDNVGIKS
ncbi:hypothetical protein [Rhizobium mayense]|uniref:Phage protein n=1 Tax=Rhizobium mayense TaxID=1312184 RepID=A0ABT7JRW6_9HYPH|nr:hypothetical protein [Rhizobium mayense]MDL2398448.1 hypothetical protein [Rhizobium mayense]